MGQYRLNASSISSLRYRNPLPANRSNPIEEANPSPSGQANGPLAEVDPRIYMAAERTFLAWIRTGVALMGLGFVVARFGLFLRELAMTSVDHKLPASGFSLPAGIGLIALGILVNIVSVIRHRRYIEAIDRNDLRSAFGSRFAFWIAGALALIGLAMAVYLVRL